MAKSKKKRKPQHPQEQHPSKSCLMYRQKNNELTIKWLITEGSETIPDRNRTFGLFPESLESRDTDTPLQATLKKAYGKDPDEYVKSAGITKTILEKIYDTYMKSLTDLDRRMNKYANDSEVDCFDFSEYVLETDLLDKAREIIDRDPDISLLFSPSEIFDIKLSDVISWRAMRIIYDDINGGVRYCIIEYHKSQLIPGVIIETPIYMFVGHYEIGQVTGDKYIHAYGTEHSRVQGISDIRKDPFLADNLEYIIAHSSEPDAATAVTCGKLGESTMTELYRWLEGNHGFISRPAYRAAKPMITAIVNEKYGAKDPDTPYIGIADKMATHSVLSISLPIAAIIVANYYLKQKKLSRPSSVQARSAAPKREVDIKLENTPPRKTRTLNGSIRLTTEKRPVSLDKEQIIRYHTPEWQRKGYLRHLKSGKIIEIAPTTCKRRCVNIGNVTDNRPKAAIDYAIKPEERTDGNNNG